MNLGSTIIVVASFLAVVYLLGIHPVVLEARAAKRIEYLIERAHHYSYYKKLTFVVSRKLGTGNWFSAIIDESFHFQVEVVDSAITQILFDDSHGIIQISYLHLSAPGGKMGGFVSYSATMEPPGRFAPGKFEVPLEIYLNLSGKVKQVAA